MRSSVTTRLRRVRAATFLLAVSAASAAGQTFLTRNYTADDGVPASEVLDVRRDAAGRVWFATRTGLAIYDGQDWEPVRERDGSSLRDVVGLRFDAQGRAWLVQASNRVLVGKPGELSVLPRIKEQGRERAPTLDFDLLSSPDGPRLALATYDRDLHVWDGTGWIGVEAVDSSLGTLRVIEGWGERLFLGTDAGLWELAADLRAARRVPLPQGVDPAVRGLLLDASGDGERLWVQGPDWLAVLGAAGVELVRTGVPEAAEAGIAPLAQAPDGRGGLYFGNEISLHHFDRATGDVTRLGRGNGLVGEGVKSLFLDREGLLWVATRLGVTKLVSLCWASYSGGDGLLEAETSALLELPDGRLLLGHNQGLDLWDGESIRSVPFEPDPDGLPGPTRVLDLEADPGGGAWIAGSAQGLGYLRPDLSVEWRALPRAPEGAAQWANCVLRDREGGVWCGASFGLLRLEGGELARVDEHQLGAQYVRSLAEAPDGRLLLATNAGLWSGERGAWSQARPRDARASPSVYALLGEADGRIWAGGRGGLWRLEGGSLVRPEEIPPFEQAVYSLLRDQDGRLWIGTDEGVLRWDGERLVQYTRRDGLSGNETNRAAALVDRRGDVWFGTDRGLSVFRARFERERPEPLVEHLELLAGGEVHDAQLGGILGAGRVDLTFRASTSTLVDEERLTWRSLLEGYDPEWHQVSGTTRFEARYPSLPAGNYRFLVQLRQGEGDWSAPLHSARLRVAGPFWTRWWFSALVVVATAGLGALGYRLVAQSRYARRLKDEVSRRTEELAASQRELARAERLHSLGELAGGIAHDFNNVLTSLTGSLSLLRQRLGSAPESDGLLHDCEQALKRAQQLSTQLLTFAKGGEPVIHTLALGQLVQDSLRLALSGSGVRCDPELPADLWPIRADPAQISQVLENLLVNARQAMPAGGAVHLRAQNVELTGDGALRPGRYVRLELRDEGPGIPPDVLPRVFEPFFTTKQRGSGLGLATASSVVARHAGRLEVSSSAGSGATFTLHLPAADGALEAPVQAPPAVGARVGGRMLVMDDEPGVRSVLGKMLESLGCQVALSGSGEEALRALSAAREAGQRFHCAILDLTVPGGMGGREILPHLRELDPELRAIATSGYTDDAVLAHPGRFGFQAALPKPFRAEDVAAALAALD